MKTGKLQIVGILVLLAYAANSYACDENSAKLVAKTYALANPMMGRENEIVSLIQANRAYFNINGGAIRCMQRLGTVLANNGLSQFGQDNRHRAAEKFAGDMPPGLEGLPGEVDRSMNSYAYDLFAMGQELRWLAGVYRAWHRVISLPTTILGHKPAKCCGKPWESTKSFARWIHLSVS